MKKMLHMILACVMLLACATTAFASPPAHSPELYENAIPVQGDPIGTSADQDGILIEDVESRANGLPFTMRANGVTGLLTTCASAGKNFTGGVFDGLQGEGLLITGTVTNTVGRDIRVGACYYQPSNDTFYSVYPLYFDSGVYSRGFIPKFANGTLYFVNQMTYYGHITRYNDAGAVSGTLNFSVSKG